MASEKRATERQSQTDDDSSAPAWSRDVPGYDIGHVIGVGGFCKVRLGTNTASGEQVALKVVEKSQAVQVRHMYMSACAHGCMHVRHLCVRHKRTVVHMRMRMRMWLCIYLCVCKYVCMHACRYDC